MFRQMRRFKQQLPDEECRQILANTKRGVLSVLGDDDYPYGVPINFVYLPSVGEHGAIYFHSALTGHKIDAITAHDKASFAVMDEGRRNEGEWWYYVKSVINFGRISKVADETLKHDALRALAEKYFPPEVDIEDDIARNGARVHMLELRIEHMTGKDVQEK